MLLNFSEISKNKECLDQIGKKALSLIELKNMELNVPDGYCLLYTAFDLFLEHNDIKPMINNLISEQNQKKQFLILEKVRNRIMTASYPKEIINDLIKKLPENNKKYYAIRSSASEEDLKDTSFAGQYATILNVSTVKNILKAIKNCWCSIFTEKIFIYCKNNEIPFSNLKMAVIIQEMVFSEKSGVVFTINPVSGNDKELVIEACFGLGESLVKGEVTPDSYFYDWYNGKEPERIINKKSIALIINSKNQIEKINLNDKLQSSAVLSKEEVINLSNISLSIQSKYGYPVDIEWVYKDGKFYMLQTRPITKINYNNFKYQWTAANWIDWNISFSVCSQFMANFYKKVFSNTMIEYLKDLKVRRKEKKELWADVFYGRLYWNVSAVKEYLKKLPGYVERKFDEDIGVQVNYEGQGYITKLTPKSLITGVRLLLSIEKSLNNRLILNEKIYSEQIKNIDKINKINIKIMSNEDLFNSYEKLIKEDFYAIENAYSRQFFEISNVLTLFNNSIKKYKNKIDYIKLLNGLRDIAHLSVYRKI